jgi:exonuclease SbcC
MRILAIRGKNLASLAGEFAIDFQAEPLGSAGLFAITGPTGAGKSTLLDALCLALYEKTPRLAKARGEHIPDVGDNDVLPSDPRTILRRGAAEGHAEVDFVGSDGVSYRARWNVRRSRVKVDGKLQQSEVSFSRLVDGQVLSDHRKSETLRLIEAKIGLNFDQFTRAVLLAQNEFAAFLRASDDERAELLQTLTGTETFTLISQQAYARMKTEKEQLDRLQAQLQDQAPLTPELRTETNNHLLAQDEKVKALESSKSLEEAQLRWFKQLDDLTAAWLKASQQLEAARAEQAAAAPRQSYLTTLEQVQSARPICVEFERLGTEVLTHEQGLHTASSAFAANASALTNCTQTQQSAIQRAGKAEADRTLAQPLIAKARELDAAMQALEPQRQLAIKATDLAQAQATEFNAQKVEAEKKLAASHEQIAAAQTWLAGNEALRTLAEGWQRWEGLFENAQSLLTAQQQAAQKTAELATQAAAIANSTQEKQAVLTAAAKKSQQTQQDLAARQLDCATLDLEKLAQEKQRLDLRRDHLQSAANLWQQLVDGLKNKAKLEQQREPQATIVLTCEQEQLASGKQQPLMAQDVQAAQQSLDLANLAAGKDAKSLRAKLKADNPCPVCGATDHPYADQSPQSDAILSVLKAQVDNKRQALDSLIASQAASTAKLAAATSLIKSIDSDMAALVVLSQERQTNWQALELQAELAVETDQGSWLEAQQVRVKGELEWLAGDEKSSRDKLLKRDQAQVAVTSALDAEKVAQEAINQQTLTQKLNGQELEVQAQLIADSGTKLAELQLKLDPAFPAQSWRDQWSTEAKSFVDRCSSQAEDWRLRQQKLLDLTHLIKTQQSEHTGCEKANLQAAKHLKTQADQLSKLANEIQQYQGERSKIFEGRPTPTVEAKLNSHLAQAKAEQSLAQTALEKVQSENTRLTESVKLFSAQLEKSQSLRATALGQLDGWLAAYCATAGDAALAHADLKQMLAISDDWMKLERAALQAMGAAVTSGQAVLEEHRRAKIGHEAGKTVQDDQETLRAKQAATLAALEAAAIALNGLKLAIAQDDERLSKSLALRAEIETQGNRSKVWSQLSELIGSADGKKFRNFAQQLTLDILLHDANQHLQSLSRRYRLERIKDSLGLLVVDQDMGDERRSVHSLSGGESFLVSLGLALGLASLSSHRVRVESLFIDEGFGSLDADSLRVAMDALDNLQALGRKVGVISHVQEMTERIGTRINVRRTSGGQSKVTVT